MQVSERITKWREWAGISKAELSRRVGVSSSAVAQWENDPGTTPTVDNLTAIAEACGISLSMFWGEIPKRNARAS